MTNVIAYSIDKAGNQSSNSAILPVRIDRTAPAFTSAGITVSNETAISFRVAGTATDAHSGNTASPYNGSLTYECTVSPSTGVRVETVNNTGTFDITGCVANTTYTVTMTATDKAGKVGTKTKAVTTKGELKPPKITFAAKTGALNGEWYT